MDESIVVSSITDKLSPSLKDYKNSLKHKREDISLEELGRHLCIEEENRPSSHDEQSIMSSKINMVEEKKESNQPQHQKDNKRKFLQR